MSARPTGDEVKLRRVTQVVSDLYGGALQGVRVLDLACLEGMYSLELASRGADVVALEAREANIEKARFAGRVMGLQTVEFLQEDVRTLSLERHGTFDVVLCLGLLYHLDAPDLFPFVERLGEVCTRALVVDTATARHATRSLASNGHAYRGETLVEHDPSSSSEQRLEAVWSSIDNVTSVALTRPSLVSLLARSGFTSIYEVHVPAEPAKHLHRVTLLALPGKPVGPLLTPEPDADAVTVPELPPLVRRLEVSRLRGLGRRAVPRPLRGRLRRILGGEVRHH